MIMNKPDKGNVSYYYYVDRFMFPPIGTNGLYYSFLAGLVGLKGG